MNSLPKTQQKINLHIAVLRALAAAGYTVISSQIKGRAVRLIVSRVGR